MTSVFAIFFRLPFDKGTLCIFEENQIISVEKNKKFSEDTKLICLNFHEYVNGLESTESYSIPNQIFDLNVALRILEGIPAQFFNNENYPWKGIACLGKHFTQTKDFIAIRSIESGKFGSFSEWLSILPNNWHNLFINAMKEEFSRLKAALISLDIYEQFQNTEMYLLSVFSRSGIKGLSINEEKTIAKWHQLDREYFMAVKRLEFSHKFNVGLFDWKLTYNDIKSYVPSIDQSYFSKKNFWESLKYLEELSPFISDLLTIHRNRIDMAELLRIQSLISGNCRLNYEIMGTVSGRILVSRPGIQYLKRTSRDIFIPSTGKVFIYADYSQFEPGILAGISGDPNLVQIYNDGDVYTGLAEIIGNGCNRKVAKELFLAFIYGMKKANIKSRITEKYGQAAAIASESFFSSFNTIEEWKNRSSESAVSSKVVMGKFKYPRKVTQADTVDDVGRWAPNHIIQSTASGIFKEALVAISRTVECRLLIPMHDAILVECPTENESWVRAQIEKLMTETFKRAFPSIQPRISFNLFHE